MDLYLINALLIVGVLVVMSAALLAIRQWYHKGVKQEDGRLTAQYRAWKRANPHYVSTGPMVPLPSYGSERLRQLARFFLLLNILTTIIGLVPLGFAVYNLVTNNQRQALNFNLVALATLVVTKGGLFVLTVVLIPAAKAIPGAIAGGYAWKKVNEALDARKKEKPPTT